MNKFETDKRVRRAELHLQEMLRRADGIRDAALRLEEAQTEVHISVAVARASLEPQLPLFVQLWTNDPRQSGLSMEAHQQLRVMLTHLCEDAEPLTWPACVLVFWATDDLESAGFAGEASVRIRFFDDNAGVLPRPELARWSFRYPKAGLREPKLDDYLAEFRAQRRGGSAPRHSGDQ